MRKTPKSTHTKKSSKTRITSDALEILEHLNRDDPEMQELIREAEIRLRIAQLIYDARQRAGLTQTQLAKRVGTTKGIIDDLENADYQGDSLTMLMHITEVLGRGVEIRLTPPARRAAPTA
ncbi:MAG: XRE family transcriptional regulator [Candidatus Hydrogenedentes bacterium]|nr:XRE family transcriptional regulator [Candidatus Hydrogenedentota bacterium]